MDIGRASGVEVTGQVAWKEKRLVEQRRDERVDLLAGRRDRY